MSDYNESCRGSSTIEAIISLSVFILAIMFVYSQIKVVIGENIMQNAVNNMAKETASYVYILDRLGFVLDHSADDNKDINALVGDGKDALNDITEFTGDLFGGNGSSSDDLAGSLKEFVDALKESKNNIVSDLNNIDKEDIKNGAVNAGENAVKKMANLALSKYYNVRLDKYLPMEREKFCRYYNINIEDGAEAFSFNASRVFPTTECNSVLVAVTYKVKSPIKFIPLERKICKYAYTAAWVSSNTYHIKK